MLGAGIYPITLAEMVSYSKDADKLFEEEEHERLKEFLALHPESGDVIPGTGGVRLLRWPLKPRANVPNARIVYFFRDLNMPLYLLALYKKHEKMSMNSRCKREIEQLVNELVETHFQRWARLIARQESGA